MTTLASAPLVEVIFELRWGVFQDQSGALLRYDLRRDREELLPGALKEAVHKDGFGLTEPLNPPDVPHFIKYRFRRSAGMWPCIQIGTGIFTVNQVNEGYDWRPFCATVMSAYARFIEAVGIEVDTLENPTLVLRYQDAFIKRSKESIRFLSEVFSLNLELPTDFLKDHKSGKDIGLAVQAEVPLSDPEGEFIIELRPAHINGESGYVLDSRVVSRVPKANREFDLEGWLERAHQVNKKAFSSLIKPAYMESLK